MEVHDNRIIFWPIFGSKIDSARHTQSGWELRKNDVLRLDCVYWIDKLLKVSAGRRSTQQCLNQLFIATRGKTAGASASTIRGWIRTAFQTIGIGNPPGSTRSAVASYNCSVYKLSVEEVLARGNWKSSSTFIKHYFKDIDMTQRPQTNGKAEAYSALADETADVSGKEQLSIGIRYFVEKKNKIQKVFVLFTELQSLDAKSVAQTIDEFLTREELNPSKCVGLGFDGCSTKSGIGGGHISLGITRSEPVREKLDLNEFVRSQCLLTGIQFSVVCSLRWFFAVFPIKSILISGTLSKYGSICETLHRTNNEEEKALKTESEMQRKYQGQETGRVFANQIGRLSGLGICTNNGSSVRKRKLLR
nr:unnamed protein product [Callosobruchus chinensis]